MTPCPMFRIFCILLAFVCSSPALAPERNAVFVRVVDVGAGLCCVVKMPGGHNLVYDAGNYADGGRTAFAAVQQLIPRGESIDLLVLSHTDSDHVAATKAICDTYAVKRIIHPGITRTTATWRQARTAINAEARTGQCEVFNLNQAAMAPG